MKKWFFIIDVAKCWDCNNCFISCKDEFENNDWPGYSVAQPRHEQRWMDVQRCERGQYPLIDVAYRPTPCMHCQDAPCVKASGGAIVCREDGIVLIDPEKAKGRKDLVSSCPYGTIYWNEEREVAQKCTMCAHLLDDGWKQPRCAQACFTGALTAHSLEEAELEELIRSENLRQLKPELNSRPNVYYKNLHRFDKCFIAGSAAVKKDEIVDCAAGVRVVLYRDNKEIGEAITDTFGDFKFDGLDPKSGMYVVELQTETGEKESVEVELDKSRNIGTVFV